MRHDYVSDSVAVRRPPLRQFLVTYLVPGSHGVNAKCANINAHLVFDNTGEGGSLVFRRYYDDDVRTEKVAEFREYLNYIMIEDYPED